MTKPSTWRSVGSGVVVLLVATGMLWMACGKAGEAIKTIKEASDLIDFKEGKTPSAKGFKSVADKKALDWSSRAKLTTVIGNKVGPDGLLMEDAAWAYYYVDSSVSPAKSYTVLVYRNGLTLGTQDERPPEVVPQALPGDWLDSIKALEVGAQHGGKNYMDAHPKASIVMTLSAGSLEEFGSKTVWMIVYTDPPGGALPLAVFVDASNERFLSSNP